MASLEAINKAREKLGKTLEQRFSRIAPDLKSVFSSSLPVASTIGKAVAPRHVEEQTMRALHPIIDKLAVIYHDLFIEFFDERTKTYPYTLKVRHSLMGSAKASFDGKKEVGRIQFENTGKAKQSYKNFPVDMPAIVAYVLGFIHEYSHNTFLHLVDKEYPDLWGHTWNPLHSLDEGFASMIELLFVDLCVHHVNEIAPNHEMAEKIRICLDRWKIIRVKLFKETYSKNRALPPNDRGEGKNLRTFRLAGYAEGLFKFWHKIYRTGGLPAMREVLDNLDPVALWNPIRDKKIWDDILDKPDVEKRLEWFVKRSYSFQHRRGEANSNLV